MRLYLLDLNTASYNIISMISESHKDYNK